MKKFSLLIAVIALSTTITFTACKKNTEKQSNHEEVTDETGEALPISADNPENNDTATAQLDTNSTAHVHYFCPMYCEGDKMYDEDVPCPVCGMKLKTKEHEGH